MALLAGSVGNLHLRTVSKFLSLDSLPYLTAVRFLNKACMTQNAFSLTLWYISARQYGIPGMVRRLLRFFSGRKLIKNAMHKAAASA